MSINAFITNLLDVFVNVMTVLVFGRAIISWIPNAHGKISDIVVKLTDPFLNPIRRLNAVVGGVDFSPLVFLFLINILRSIIYKFFNV